MLDIRPVAGTGNRAGNFKFLNQGFDISQVLCFEGAAHAFQNAARLFLVLHYPGVCAEKLVLVKSISKTFSRLVDFLFNLFLNFSDVIFYEHISPIPFFGIFIIDQRVIEGIDVARGLPGRRVHKNSSVDPNDILIELHHRLPPVFLYVLLEFCPILCVVVNSAQTVVNLAGLGHITVFLGM